MVINNYFNFFNSNISKLVIQCFLFIMTNDFETRQMTVGRITLKVKKKNAIGDVTIIDTITLIRQ
jgi:hypothetical protein